MNLPEYRQAVRRAQMRFEESVRQAAEALAKDLAAADEEFFEPRELAAVAIDEDYAVTRRRS